MKRSVLAILACLFFAQVAFSNSAMPGLWTPGANGRFVPLFASDSIHFGHIQMQHEQVLVNLYPGFAVVKGEYYMYNTTDKSIHMHVAYPKQAKFSDTLVKNVIPAYIANLKVLVNDQPTPLMRSKEDAFNKMLEDERAQQAMTHGSNAPLSPEADKTYENWFLWRMDFAPHTITKITVYFLTDNSNAHLRRGYSGDEACGFTYVLESGRAWGGAIDSGKIYIQLKDSLTTKDIKAVLPHHAILADATHLRYTFTNKEPTEKDNLLIWYKAVPKDSAFEKKIIPSADTYFAEIDKFNTTEFNNTSFAPLNVNNFEVHSSNFFTWIFYGFLFIAALVLFMVGYGIIRWIKKSNQKTQHL